LARRTFDDAFVYRRKMGFLLPLVACFSHPRFRAMMEDQILPGIRRHGWMEERVVRAWWGNGGTDPGGISIRLWLPLILEIWAQQFLDYRRERPGQCAVPCVTPGAPIATRREICR
jgi:hypothetical protein